MYKQYIKQAWQLMKQNRFFSTVYVIGTGLAISMVMVMAVVYHIRTANIAPEVHRDRMCYLSSLSYVQGNMSRNSHSYGLRTIKECILPMTTPELIAIKVDPMFLRYIVGDSYLQIPGGDVSPKVSLMATNDSFWQIYRFRFLAGKPYDGADVSSSLSRAVVNEKTARKLFGKTDVINETVLLNGVEYSVCGVVADVSAITQDVYADVWIPYSSIPGLSEVSAVEQRSSLGPFTVCVLLHSPRDMERFLEEWRQQIKQYNTTLADGKLEGEEPLMYTQNMLHLLFMQDWKKTSFILLFVLLLFLLVPALNLSGLNMSHMHDRIPELGVRRAFGACKSTLLMQLLTENLLLMLPGGVAGLLFSYLLVWLLRNLLLGSFITMMSGGAMDMSLSLSMLVNMQVFGYAFLICLVLNLLSSIVPAMRALRIHITDALANTTN
ncbi:ABC transporter permease [Parabacteroides bouchesdurhonensis]|uniref:ABC transporter permease n=1 Tax=Parabacteroides bouchesdurhonensis TaxID=1936995 RepID=UPI000E471D83|nr:ABC transporter permease [Parabacteroides bouchesdurhonensis]RHJ92429.1 ABC transporter permease [Bacteroides sp. AM07-16]